MPTSTSSSDGQRRKAPISGVGSVPLEHYARLIFHRKWLILGVFLVVTVGTAIFAYRLPDIYSADTVVLVDPQKVPESYVKSTVTGDVRNRLGTLSQQILSATRLQRIIDTLNLFPQERKVLTREELILRMRANIGVQVLSEFSASQDLQAFKISYSGRDPRLVAQVTNELASLFIEENLKAREQQATGTTDFLQNQLQATRTALEAQENKLRDFRLKHVGEMPEQQYADLQILGQLQSQLQLEGDALGRAEQQRTITQNMMTVQSAPVVELDDGSVKAPKSADGSPTGSGVQSAPVLASVRDKAKLAELLVTKGEKYPDVKKLRQQIKDEEAFEARQAKVAQEAQAKAVPPKDAATTPAESASPGPVGTSPAPPVSHFNPVLQSQMEGLNAEIDKHKGEVQRLSKLISAYQAKLEAIPVREQEITELVRDYEISKAHYSQLLNNQLSAETAKQLEIRQKGEKFNVLDTAQVPEKPSRPDRRLIDMGGGMAGLALGLLLALATEFLGISITGPEQIVASTGLPVLEVIPVIQTRTDRLVRRRRIFFAAASGVVAALAISAILVYHYRTQLF